MFKQVPKGVCVLALLLAIVTSVQFTYPGSFNKEKAVEAYYFSQLLKLKLALIMLEGKIKTGSTKKELKDEFLKCRLLYKKLAVLTDYFNPYETRLLNSAAINRIESEVSDSIVPPSGFQAIEDVLFNGTVTETDKLLQLTQDMIPVLDRLQKEPDIQFKFKDELLWDAMRSAIAAIITTGITGLDSPTANYSLPEAAASLEGIQTLLDFFKEDIEATGKQEYKKVSALLLAAKKHVSLAADFNTFNRLVFTTDYLNPVYSKLVTLRIKMGIAVPGGRNAINFNALSIFDSTALNINFYSPPQEYWVTPERVQLGKRLFSDPILSGTNTRSCASCHQPARAFTDGLVKPYGLDDTTLLARNTPTLLNSGYQIKQFYDLRTDLLENQLGEVVHNVAEMKGSLKKSVADLKASAAYTSLFVKAYPAEKESVNTFTIANAISCYVRSLQSLNSRFDQYMRGNKLKLSLPEQNGFNLFAGKAKCASCHFIPLFNGTVPPFYGDNESEVLGVPATKNKKAPVLDGDPGRFLFTGSVIHKYAFKTPTLRNIALTAPYMHNGVFSTLEEVMEFYNNGGGKGLGIAPENQTLPFDKLNLSKKEIRDIIAFLKTLTDAKK